MTAVLLSPKLNDVIGRIKRMEPLTQEEELLYLMQVRNMQEAEALDFIMQMAEEDQHADD